MKISPFFLLLLTLSARAEELSGRILRVSDGTSLTLQDNHNHQQPIRLYGLAAPSLKQPGGSTARELLQKLVKNQDVRAHCHGTSPKICVLADATGGDLGAELLRRGGAWVQRASYKSGPYFTLEDSARAAGVGLWAEKEYQKIAPWDWQRCQQQQAGTPRQRCLSQAQPLPPPTSTATGESTATTALPLAAAAGVGAASHFGASNTSVYGRSSYDRSSSRSHRHSYGSGRSSRGGGRRR